MKTSIIYIITFALLISLIGILSIFRLKTLESNEFFDTEMRKPAEKPEWVWKKESIKSYFPKLESFINDNFSLRSDLIKIFSSIHYKFGISVKPNMAVIGKNGFVFLGNNVNQVIDQTNGRNLFTESELQAWNDAFLQRKKYLEECNIKYYVVIAPNKHSIYPEYLPSYIQVSDNNRLQQILNYKPDFNIINLMPGLISAKEEWGDLLYNKTDSHWSFIGAYLAYVDMINNLNNDFKEIKPLLLGKENFNKITHEKGYSTIHQLYITSKVDDFFIQIKETENWEKDIIKTNFEGDTLPFSYKQCITVNEKSIVYNKHKPYTLLLLKDSFSEKMSPFLNQTFGKIIYCHYEQNEGKELTQLIEKFKPDIVITELVQRMLIIPQTLNPSINFKLRQNKLKAIYTLDGSYLVEHSKPENDIANFMLSDNSLSFSSIGNDPFLIIPNLLFPQKNKISIKVDFSVPESTTVQLFYFTGNSKTAENLHEIKYNIEKGRNTVYFNLPETGIDGGYLRFDPGLIKGEYKIYTIDIFEELE